MQRKIIMNNTSSIITAPRPTPKAVKILSGIPKKSAKPHCESHRSNSRFKELVEDSPGAVEQCTTKQFLVHLFGDQVNSVLVTDDVNVFHMEWSSNPAAYRYFNPITLNKSEEQRAYGNKITQNDVLKLGDLQYAAFEVCAATLPEQFTLEVQTGGYPTVAIVSVDETTVHMVCKVNATSMEQYQDRCELILRMAHDIYDCERTAKQIVWCRTPSIECGNLLYLDPAVKWGLPIYTKDFA